MKILYVGPSYGGQILQQAKEYGLDVVYVEHPDRLDPALTEVVAECYPLDFKDEAHLYSFTKDYLARDTVDAVISLGEGGVIPAAKLSERFGIPTLNPLSAVENAMDKYQTRRILDQAGIPNIPYRLCHSHEEVLSFMQWQQKPVILKPHNGFGSMGVHLIASPDQAGQALKQVTSSRPGAQVLAEVFLRGVEVSVEAFSYQGEHHIVAVTDKYTTGAPHFVETGHVIPSILSQQQREAVEQITLQTLQAIGMQNGPSHTEIMVTPAGCYVIETHTRPGGDEILRLVTLAKGVDMVTESFRVLEGKKPHLTPIKSQAAAIRYLTPSPGTVTHIDVPPQNTWHHAIHEVELAVEIGEEIPVLRHSFQRGGYVMATGDNSDEIRKYANDMAVAIVMKTEEGVKNEAD